MKKILSIMLLFLLVLAGCSSEGESANTNESDSGTEEVAEARDTETTDAEQAEEAPEVEETPQVKMIQSIQKLIEEGSAFDAGSYIKGDIPKGEYAFTTFDGSGQYYSEEDSAGNIIDNENFDSFGYVNVHEAGNIKTSGVLVKVDALEKLGVSGAKELYEIVNDQEDYTEAGYYKVGADLKPGQYVIESFGEGYVALMTGPVGNGEIVDNEIFNGKYSINANDGQYLKISRGTLVK